MAKGKSTEKEVYLAPGLSQPAQRALKDAGYVQLEQLAGVKEGDLLKLHGVGPRSIEILRQALSASGLAFAEGPSHPGQPVEEQVYDSPRDFVTIHIREYVESNGQQGFLWLGCPTLLLTTRGRKSGKLRRTALIFGQDGTNYLVVASYGGRPEHPYWYLNLVENPEVQIQVGAEKLKALARTANSQEKERLWPVMSKIFPTYDEYLIKARQAGREIPLIILEPK